VHRNGRLGLFNTVVPPSSNQWTFSFCYYEGGTVNHALDAEFGVRPATHPGGANFLFADGASTFIKSSISLTTYWALGNQGKRRDHLVRHVTNDAAPQTDEI